MDASRSISDQPTGTELYSRYLIDALLARAPIDYAFRLYFNRQHLHGAPAPVSATPALRAGASAGHPQPAIRDQRLEIRNLRLPRLWTHIRLSLEMLLHPPDVLFVPAHVLPIVHPRRSVVTVHDLGYLYFPEAHPPRQRWYLDRTTRWHARTAAHIIADSNATKRDLIDRYQARPDRVSVAYPGLDPAIQRVDDPGEIARVKAKYHIDSDYVLYLGTLQPRKNLSRLIEAFQSPISNLQLLIAGKRGWYADQLIRRATERVRFMGYVGAEDKSALLSGATAFVFPSLYEGFGFPVLEAMACGVPVVCSNTSSLPEVAGDAALQVDPLNVGSIADGLVRITTNVNLRHTLIERGLQQSQRFTWQACADVVLKVFKQVLTR